MTAIRVSQAAFALVDSRRRRDRGHRCRRSHRNGNRAQSSLRHSAGNRRPHHRRADVFLILLSAKAGLSLRGGFCGRACSASSRSPSARRFILADPQWGGVIRGFIPTTDIVTNPDMLYLALGILGATVMPHNLYLHSAVVQTRRIGDSGRRQARRHSLRHHRFNGRAHLRAFHQRVDPCSRRGSLLRHRECRGRRTRGRAFAAGAAAWKRHRADACSQSRCLPAA